MDDLEEWLTIRRQKDSERAELMVKEAINKSVEVIEAENNNAFLARTAVADAAVQVVMDQLGAKNPTLLSAWTKLEIARLLHALHADVGGEITLGGQTLSGGFKDKDKPKQLGTLAQRLVGNEGGGI